MISDMATESIKTRVDAFDNDYLTRLHEDNFVIDYPDHVFYLQDDDGKQYGERHEAANPPDAEYRT
jgi:hypothetical protein